MSKPKVTKRFSDTPLRPDIAALIERVAAALFNDHRLAAFKAAVRHLDSAIEDPDIAAWPALKEALVGFKAELDEAHDDTTIRGAYSAPAAVHGKKFTGRRKGAVGPITKAVDAALETNPKASAIKIWDAISQRPPKDYRLVNSTRLGRYIEKGAREVMRWPHFQNKVSERKKLLK